MAESLREEHPRKKEKEKLRRNRFGGNPYRIRGFSNFNHLDFFSHIHMLGQFKLYWRSFLHHFRRNQSSSFDFNLDSDRIDFRGSSQIG